MNSADLRVLASTLEKSARVLRQVADHQDVVAGVLADASILAQPVAALNLSVRARRALSRGGVVLVRDLVMLTEADLKFEIPGLGITTFHEIEAALAAHDLVLRKLTRKNYVREIEEVRTLSAGGAVHAGSGPDSP